jgi:hypothetical protein
MMRDRIELGEGEEVGRAVVAVVVVTSEAAFRCSDLGRLREEKGAAERMMLEEGGSEGRVASLVAGRKASSEETIASEKEAEEEDLKHCTISPRSAERSASPFVPLLRPPSSLPLAPTSYSLP